ncbi:MAG: hypothetical protein C0507_03530 [Cyanobacteria bacterium PR.3.49]|nr:hypothetical protein [Cyanobacteria bacterium PR.3.49]
MSTNTSGAPAVCKAQALPARPHATQTSYHSTDSHHQRAQQKASLADLLALCFAAIFAHCFAPSFAYFSLAKIR